jgi:hypothetical protein
MGTFKSSKTIYGPPALIPQIGRDVMDYFMAQGYDVQGDSLISGGYDISVSKGNLFKAVLGMKTALKILIRPQSGQIWMEAGVGIFGQQAIPTLIAFFITWPVVVTQIWGMVKQSKLDEKAIEIAEASVLKHNNSATASAKGQSPHNTFCTHCGAANPEGKKYCGECGGKI